MAQINYRTVNVDAYDSESAENFDLSTLTPDVQAVSGPEVQEMVNKIRTALRSGDGQGALIAALQGVPYGADKEGKDAYAHAVIEILQSIRQSEMSPLLSTIYGAEGGVELLDVLMKYLYKGMAHGAPAASTGRQAPTQSTGFSQISSRGTGEGSSQTMSVLLSWHEKLVETAGPGSIVRVMTDRRTV